MARLCIDACAYDGSQNVMYETVVDYISLRGQRKRQRKKGGQISFTIQIHSVRADSETGKR